MHLFLRNNIKSDFVTFSCLFGISFILFQYHIDYDSFSFIILIIILYKPIYYSFSDSKKKPYFGSTKNLPFSVIFPIMSTVSPEENLKKYMSKLYSCVFSYQTANSLILPIVPYLATSMNATNIQYSLSFTVYYIAQLIGKFRSSLIK